MRRLAATVLGQAGYRTLEASDGQQALDMFTVHARSIVMVVTDVVMPRMGGIELARRLRQARPDLPILFVTGYVEQSESLHESAAGTPVLLKPFSPEALLRAVSSAIQACASSSRPALLPAEQLQRQHERNAAPRREDGDLRQHGVEAIGPR